MSRPAAPFVWIDGRPYLDVAYELEPTGDIPRLSELVERLLVHQPENDIILLRPLEKAEQQLLKQATAGAAIETWA